MRNNYYIVRHGESENNVLSLYNSDLKSIKKYGLTQKGREETIESAKHIGHIHKIFSSPFRRTQETAEIFHLQTHADMHIDHRLREIDLGTLNNQPSIDLPVLAEDEPMFEGESILQIKTRVLDFIQETESLYENLNILIVTHGGPLAILQHYIKTDEPFQFTGLEKVVRNSVVLPLVASA